MASQIASLSFPVPMPWMTKSVEGPERFAERAPAAASTFATACGRPRRGSGRSVSASPVVGRR